MAPIRVLFAAADPFSYDPSGRFALEPRLALDEEMRHLDATLRTSHVTDGAGSRSARDAFEFRMLYAARAGDLLQALLEFKPQVIHFSGHASREGLVFVGAQAEPQRFVPTALARLLSAAGEGVRLLVLNACETDAMAGELTKTMDAAVGMAGAWSDAAAREFAGAFYRAIAHRCSLRSSFEQAAALVMGEVAEAEGPRLHTRAGINPETVIPEGRPTIPGSLAPVLRYENVRFASQRLGWWNYAQADPGTLLVSADRIIFQGQQLTIAFAVRTMRRVERVRIAGDIAPSWVRVDYGDPRLPSSAYFSHITKSGLDFLFGGSTDLYNTLHNVALYAWE